MRKLFIFILAIFALSVVSGSAQTNGLAASHSQAGTDITSPFGMGTYLGTGEFGREAQVAGLLAQAGVTWAREEFPWTEIEPQLGQYRWRWEDRDYDAAVDALRAEGVQVIGLLDYGPNPSWSPGNLQAWLPNWRTFVRQMVQHYRGRIRYWEIQNEENSRGFWQKVDPNAPNPSPQDYARLLSAAYDEIKRTDPEAKVILGGLAGYTSDLQDPAQNYFHYLDQLHQAGAWDAFDILAVHPYREVERASPEQPIERGNYDPDRRTFDPNAPQRWNLVQELSALDRMIAQFGTKPIWITELGWSREALQARAGQRGTTAEIVQADYLVRTYVPIMALPNVERLFWFRFRDRDLTFGLVDNHYSATESYLAYQKMTTLLQDSQFLKQRRGADYAAAPGQDDVFEYRFQQGDQIIIVLWKATGGDVPRSVTVSDIVAPTVRIIDPGTRIGPTAGREVQTVNRQINLDLTERPVFIIFGTPRVTRQTEVQTTWPIGRYTFAVEGQGTIRLFVDGDPVLETAGRGQESVWLRRGCHQVAVEYDPGFGPPRLGFSRWPSAPDFEAGLPPCEETPPGQPANTPDVPVRTFFEAMDRLDVEGATEAIAPVPGYRQVAGGLLGLYKRTMDTLNWDNDFSQLQYQVVSNDGRSATVRVWGPVAIRSTEDGSVVTELDDFQVEVPVSNFLVRWYIYVGPQSILPGIEGGYNH